MNRLKAKVNQAFAKLRKMGVETVTGNCCNTCSIADAKTDRFVYYHKQNDFKLGVNLGFSDQITALALIAVLREKGLNVKWDGSQGTKVYCELKSEAKK